MVENTQDLYFKLSIGATKPHTGRYVLDEDTEESSDSSDSAKESSSDSELDFENEEDLDAYMSSAAHTGKPKGILVEMISKVWRIDLETAKKTLNVTSQNCVHSDNPSFTRNYGTGDRMLRYKRMNQYFLWTHSLLPQKVEHQQEAILVANSLSETKVLFT